MSSNLSRNTCCANMRNGRILENVSRRAKKWPHVESISSRRSKLIVEQRLLLLLNASNGTRTTWDSNSKSRVDWFFMVTNRLIHGSCRREQRVYDACMEKKLKMQKAPFGYFSQLRLHETSRPKPAPFLPEWPQKTPGLPQDYEGLKEPPRGGSRAWWHAWSRCLLFIVAIDLA